MESQIESGIAAMPTDQAQDAFLNADEISEQWAQRMANDRQSLQRRDTENFLRTLTKITFAQRTKRWRRDYSSLDSYQSSVAPMRAEWGECVGLFDLKAQADGLTLTPYFETDAFTA